MPSRQASSCFRERGSDYAPVERDKRRMMKGDGIHSSLWALLFWRRWFAGLLGMKGVSLGLGMSRPNEETLCQDTCWDGRSTRWMDLDLYQGSATSPKQLSLHVPCVREWGTVKYGAWHHTITFGYILSGLLKYRLFLIKRTVNLILWVSMHVWVPKGRQYPNTGWRPHRQVSWEACCKIYELKKIIWCKVKRKIKDPQQQKS